jgi:serine/threonine-protein kinase
MIDSGTRGMVEDFGPYRIVRRIAVGGMAEIYLARQRAVEGLERTVVLKRILPSYIDNPEFVTMFLDEARLLAGLSHPNIAQVFDLGKIEETYYLVMEYVRGPTLGGLLSAASRAGHVGLPEPAALAIALGVAEALAYAHGRRDELGRPLNIVHRDLNPANVMVSYEGAVKLIDFGIAKAATKVYETRTGVIKGTYGYIAPEQLTRTAPVDHRADVFALGVLLYEMCVGQHPFDVSDEPNLIDRILNASYKRPRQVVPSFPKVLDRLIASCLSPHPEGRPDDVRTLIDSLAKYMGERGMVPTMGEIARTTHALVPDTEGPAPLRPLSASQIRRPFGNDPSRTMKLPQAGDEDATMMETPNLADILEGQELTMRVANPDSMEAHIEVDDGGETVVAAMRAARRQLGRMPPAREETADLSGMHTSKLSPIAGETTDAGKGKLRVASGKHRAAAGRRSARLRTIALFGASAALVAGVGALAFVSARAIGENDPVAAAGPRTAATPPPDVQDSGAEPEVPLAMIDVLSEPAGASVSVDGMDVAQVTPAVITLAEDADSVWIRVSMPGYITQERQVHASVGEARFVLTALDVRDAGEDEAEEPVETTKTRPVPRRRRRR